MYKTQTPSGKAVTFKHYSYKNYGMFASLKREIRIGILSVATLTTVHLENAGAQTDFRPVALQDQEHELEEVVVSGTLAPLTALQSARIVTVLSREEIQRASVQSINDLLKLAVSVDVRQRGGFGIQTDISIDGGTFDQITLLLNGVNIDNPQTGHFSADFPVQVSDIERIEILEGAASRVYGSSAFGGAINIVTRKDTTNTAEIHAQGGSYGSWGSDLLFLYSKNAIRNHVSGSYTQSDGGTENSNFKKGHFFYRGTYSSSQMDVNWQAGYSNKSYGANTFYSAAYPNQYERNSRYMVSIGAETKGKIRFSPSVYWDRSTDNFELIRNSTTGENFHRTDVYGAHLRGYFNWQYGKTAFGMDVRNEGILSTNLGKPLEEEQQVSIPGQKGLHYTKRDNRTNIGYYLEHNLLLQQFTFSAGLMANLNTAVDSKYRLYPGIDISYRPAEAWKVYASWNMGLRMPTFTDLYYKSPTIEGNQGLKPEEMQSFSIGTRYSSPCFNATVRTFYHKGTNMIDWVMYHAEDAFHSANFNLDKLGVGVQSTLLLRPVFGDNFPIERFTAGYTYIHQTRHDKTPVYKSNYALEYLRHKFVAQLDHRIWNNLSAHWCVRWQDRAGNYLLYRNHQNTGQLVSYSPFAIVDLKLQWTTPRYMLYVEGNNLSNRRHYDLGNIPQAGIWIMAGAKWNIRL